MGGRVSNGWDHRLSSFFVWIFADGGLTRGWACSVYGTHRGVGGSLTPPGEPLGLSPTSPNCAFPRPAAL